MRGLVIGRFQPLHKGHEALIRAAIEDCVHVTVGIGSSTARQSPSNPFSYDERAGMVKAVFGDSVDVVAIPDIHDPPNYANHVMEITGAIDRVFGNDDRTLDLFEDEGLPIRRPGLKDRHVLEGKTLRMQMAEGDGGWRKAVSPQVASVIDGFDGSKRVRLLELAQ